MVNTEPNPPNKSQIRPNYILLALGIAVAFAHVLLQLLEVGQIPPMFHALLIASALTLILYGIYPVPEMRGQFGNFAVAGPAALGVFTFVFVWNGMSAGIERPFIVLQNSPNLNSVKIEDGPTVELVEVDSLSDDKLVSIVVDIYHKLGKAFPEWDAPRVKQELKQSLRAILEALNFGPSHISKALTLYDSSIDDRVREDNDNDNDSQWKAIVSEASRNHREPRIFIQGVKRIPFAFLKVQSQSNAPQLLLALPGKEIDLGVIKYTVPIISNPSLVVVRNIHEGIVLQEKR